MQALRGRLLLGIKEDDFCLALSQPRSFNYPVAYRIAAYAAPHQVQV